MTLELEKRVSCFLKMSGLVFLLPQGSFEQRLAALGPAGRNRLGRPFPQTVLRYFWGN